MKNGYVKISIVFIISIIPCLSFCQTDISFNNSSTYVIRGNWLFIEGELFQNGKDITNFKNKELLKKFKDIIQNSGIIDLNKLYSINDEKALVEIINTYINSINYDSSRKTIAAILKFSKEHYATNDTLLSLAYTATKLSKKENLSKNEQQRLIRLLFEIIYPELLVKSDANRRGIWKWTINVNGDSSAISNINKVIYTLPNFFERDEIEVTSETERFSYTNFSDGIIDIEITVHFHEGSAKKLRHTLKFDHDVSDIIDNIGFTNEKIPRENDIWNWKIFLNASDSTILDKIDFVEYNFQNSYPEPIQIKENSETKFQINGFSWIPFDVNIKVVLKDGRVVYTNHRVE